MGLREHLWHQFKKRAERLGDKVTDFWEEYFIKQRQKTMFIQFLQDPLGELPQIVFCLRAVQYPASIPMSLTSLQLITSTVASFSSSLFELVQKSSRVADKLQAVRKLYDVSAVPNKIEDGHLPFPEKQHTLTPGFEIEFRKVSFRYPGNEALALDNVSFKLEEGHLCVSLFIWESPRSRKLTRIRHRSL